MIGIDLMFTNFLLYYFRLNCWLSEGRLEIGIECSYLKSGWLGVELRSNLIGAEVFKAYCLSGVLGSSLCLAESSESYSSVAPSSTASSLSSQADPSLEFYIEIRLFSV